jgi:hypothetical protein
LAGAAWIGSARTPLPLSKERNMKQRALFDIIQYKEVETIHGEVSIASPTQTKSVLIKVYISEPQRLTDQRW